MKIDIAVAWGGEVEVDAIQAKEGLALHKSQTYFPWRPRNGYQITHIKSGFRVLPVDFKLVGLDRAKVLFRALLACGDWTRSGLAVRRDKSIRAATKQIIEEAREAQGVR